MKLWRLARDSPKRILSEVVTLRSIGEMSERTRARLRELASRPDASAVMGGELRHLVIERSSLA